MNDNITMSLTAEIRASADATEDDRKQLWARVKERARALGWHDPDDDMYRTGSDNLVEANWELPGGIDAVAPVVAQLHAEFDIAYLSASDYTNVVCGTEGEQVTVCVVEEDGKKLIEIDADFGTVRLYTNDAAALGDILERTWSNLDDETKAKEGSNGLGMAVLRAANALPSAGEVT